MYLYLTNKSRVVTCIDKLICVKLIHCILKVNALDCLQCLN